jgi:two-component system OmpR family sensor kinase
LAEKRSLIQFVSVFVALNSIFLVTLSVLYYNYQKNIYTEILQNEVMNYAETAFESIYEAEDITKIDEFLLHDSRFDVALVDKHETVVYPSPNDFKLKFKKVFFTYNNHFYYIKTIELNHIKNIHYLVIRTNTIEDNLTKTKDTLYLVLFFSILFLSIVIFILSKLFLKPLRQYIEILDNFIRDATHELNTPISVIDMSLQRINSDELNSKNMKYFQHINVATRTLSHLYSDLTFVMFPSSSYPKDNIRIDTLIKERIDYFLPIASTKKITFSLHTEPSYLTINEHIICRIIDNLLSNAIKYNKKHGNIDIKLSENTLVVSDTGVGFDSALSDVIFERYKRLENSNGGFGLGLSIVKSLCELYDIKIDVESQKNIGTIFTLSWKSSQIIHAS